MSAEHLVEFDKFTMYDMEYKIMWNTEMSKYVLVDDDQWYMFIFPNGTRDVILKELSCRIIEERNGQYERGRAQGVRDVENQIKHFARLLGLRDD